MSLLILAVVPLVLIAVAVLFYRSKLPQWARLVGMILPMLLIAWWAFNVAQAFHAQ